LSERYLDLKLDELHLAHEFQMKKHEGKEEAKRVREELRQQQKLEQEIRAAREKIAKERKHFTAALRDLNARLERAIEVEAASVVFQRRNVSRNLSNIIERHPWTFLQFEEE
jgi:ElaB/YqjD/DUF883 family membrane-anchored ribosome-binding protein